jgi:hypothetical protein
LAALAQRVEVVPSTALFAGQQVPDEDAVTGLFPDSRTSAAGAAAPPAAGLATAP